MEAKIIEVVSGMCWCKFLVARFGVEELGHLSEVDTGRRVMQGYRPDDILVLDLGTREAAVFAPRGHTPEDLRKRGIWTSPLFGGFLTWLRSSPEATLANLPDLVEVQGDGGGERGSPLDELLKLCLRNPDQELRRLARILWTGRHGDSLPPGTPPTLADVKRWVGAGPNLLVQDS